MPKALAGSSSVFELPQSFTRLRGALPQNKSLAEAGSWRAHNSVVESRSEPTRVMARRSRGTNRRGKGRILDEFVAATGYNRNHAALLLRDYGKERVGGRSVTTFCVVVPQPA
jgi:hypothetical protein